MPHDLLFSLANQAKQRAQGEVTEAASEFWDAIRGDRRLPDPPFSEDFRQEAFQAFGDATRGAVSARRRAADVDRAVFRRQSSILGTI